MVTAPSLEFLDDSVLSAPQGESPVPDAFSYLDALADAAARERTGLNAEDLLEDLRQEVIIERCEIDSAHLERIIDATVRAEYALRYDLIPLALHLKGSMLKQLGVHHVLTVDDYLEIALDLAVEGCESPWET